MEKTLRGVIQGNTVLLENNEELKSFDGFHVLLTLVSEQDTPVKNTRTHYLEGLKHRPRRSSDRSAEEINRMIQEQRSYDRV